MESTLREHITLPKSAYEFLENYQRREGLPNFSASVEAAVKALKQQNLITGYKQFASDYAASKAMQKEAESNRQKKNEASGASIEESRRCKQS